MATAAVHAQPFPVKPIRIITSEPGGGNDFGARIISAALTEQLGQQVLIENRGAAGGVIAAETVARAVPDGYTMLYYGSNIWLLPFLRASVPYDPLRDFAPVTLAVRAPNILVVHPSLPVKSVKELIALAKARPGELNYGSGATGSSPHLAAELFKFKYMAGVKTRASTVNWSRCSIAPISRSDSSASVWRWLRDHPMNFRDSYDLRWRGWAR